MNDLPSEIQPADPTTRRKAVVLGLAVLIFGILTYLTTQRFIGEVLELSKTDLDESVRQLSLAVIVVAAGTSILLVSIAAWVIRTSVLTLRAERFPPPNMPVIRNTTIVTGREARMRATVGFVLSVVLVAAAIGNIGLIWQWATAIAAP
jgi:hypothetical protein